MWLGTLAETVSGKQPQVWLTTSKEQVVAVVGKRGSGKSFTLGVLIEGLVGEAESPLGRQDQPRAVIVFDPLDVYWTTRYGVAPSDNREAQRHYELAERAGFAGLSFNVDAWIPGASNRRATDPDWFRTLELSVPAMGYEEWELLLDVNLVSEPMGQAFTDALSLVRAGGYHVRGELYEARSQFGLEELRLSGAI